MIKIIKEEQYSGRTTVRIDEYVPFTVEYESNEPSTPLYWRCGDGKLSLVEIGFNKKSGIIISVTLTSINSKNVIKTNQPLKTDVIEVKGLPIFGINIWAETNSNDYSDSFKDEFNSGIQLLIGNDYLSLVFEEADRPVRYIRSKNVRFGVSSEASLSSVDIYGLNQRQIEIVKTAIE
jgi:hypothetical protein